jgi:putative membrane protein
MQTLVSRTIRVSVTGVALALAWACGGDANKEGAATPDSASVAAGDVNAAGGAVNPTEAVAFMATADQAEVQAAQIAETKATNSDVRKFAQEMVREHGRAAHEDAELAKKLNVDLKAAEQAGPMVTSVQTMAQQTTEKLNTTAKGAEFDKAYMDSQVQAHQTVLENLQRIAGTTAGGTATADTTQGATAVQQAAQKAIPHVQTHLDKARQIRAKLG